MISFVVKLKYLIGLIILIVFVGVSWYLYNYKVGTESSADLNTRLDDSRCLVLRWDSDNSRLEIGCDGKNYALNISGGNIFLVTVDKIATGQEIESVVIKGGMNWKNGFCEGDEVGLVLINDKGKIEVENLKEIRNKGPRYCKWVQI